MVRSGGGVGWLGWGLGFEVGVEERGWGHWMAGGFGGGR